MNKLEENLNEKEYEDLIKEDKELYGIEEDDDFEKLFNAIPRASGEKRFVFIGWANEEETSIYATLKYPTFGYL